jgi:glyoxylase-like metal-dependent hydrolase (beta-lactamase superfamily II)
VQQILPHLYTFTGLLVGRAYLIDDPDGLTIIDAGLGSAAAKILHQLQAAGRKPSDVKRILITHAHPDHVGGLPALRAATRAQVIASAGERPVIEGRIPVPRPAPAQLSGLNRLVRMPVTTFKPTPVDRIVEDGEVLAEVLGGLRVVATPGHAPGHLAFWQPQARLLFCGDVLMHFRGLRLPIAVGTVDMAENRRSIRTLAALQPRMICFGHGVPLRRAAAETLHAFAKRET